VLSSAPNSDDLWRIPVEFRAFLILFLDGTECWHCLPGHFTRGQGARKLFEVPFGGTGEGWRRPVGPTFREMKYCEG
jgi:hypothetical protein